MGAGTGTGTEERAIIGVMSSIEHGDASTVAQTAPAGWLSLPSIKLVIVDGPDRGREVTARRGVVRVGTARDNDLVLSDDTVSRRHFEVRLRSTEVRLV